MPVKFAKDQPIGFKNSIERLAIVGTDGRIVGTFAEALLKTGKHPVTALVRPDSKGVLPARVKAASINYDDESTLVKALKGQQFLIITLSVTTPPHYHSKLVQAAAKAGVPYVMPNSYGGGIQNEALQQDAMYNFGEKHREIERLDSLTLPLPCFGFDIKSKKVTFYDDGKTRINVSTWLQCGRALARLLSLKELPEDENDSSPTISQWKNKPLYIASSKVSQRDMLDSINRVTGTTDND